MSSTKEVSRKEARGPATELLVRRAKSGDRRALEELLERYYGRWLAVYHGKLGSVVRRVYDTQALVHSALSEAMRDLPQLRNEGAFFCWVTAIIRHKLAKKHRELEREVRQDLSRKSAGDEDERTEREVEADDYIATLDAILGFFPRYQGPMAAVSLRLLEDCSVEEVIARLGRSRRTIYRWLKEGIELLRARLSQ